MLRYYEQIGLIKSLRMDDYFYRVYDEDTLKRLQQIILLRKLQIPVKKICVILDNPKAAAVIDILKENIAELEKEILALSAIKTILENFVSEIEKIAAIHLSLDLLSDDSVRKLASLSLIQRNVKENRTMTELNSAAENLDQFKEKLVRVILMPPATVACVSAGKNTPDDPWGSYTASKDIMDQFIQDAGLLKAKPDFRYFGYGHDPYAIMVTIPEDMEVPEPLTKSVYPGGLFAAYINSPEVFDDWKILEAWAENSEDYEWEVRGPRLEEYFNPRNLYGLQKADSEYYDFLLPIKEIKRGTDAQKEKLADIEKLFSQQKPMEIDLTTMVNDGKFDLQYENGLMKIINDRDGIGMKTPQQFKVPLKIELRAKCDGQICIKFAKGVIGFNWHHIHTTLFTGNIDDGEFVFYKKRGEIPVDEFVDIEWLIGKDVMAIKVDGDIRHIEDDSGYIKSFEADPAFAISSAVTLATGIDSYYGHIDKTLAVESLRVTEI